MGLLSGLYRIGLLCREAFNSDFKHPRTLPAKVISVGNLTLGGTGKTPAVIAVAQEALKRGLHPCVLTRGYRGKAKGPCVVRSEFQISNFKFQTCYGADAGDEATLMAETLDAVPIVKCADRYKGGMFAIDNSRSGSDKGVMQYTPTLFILDDGFQHRGLHRDIDVLLIDAANPFGNGKLFPEGRLREPLQAMGRAHVIVLTRADLQSADAISSLTNEIRKYNVKAPVYTASHSPSALVSISGKELSTDTLKGKKICAFAGIAAPSGFQAALTALGAGVARFVPFRDHHTYKQRDIDKIRAEAAGLDIITTEKDMVKLKGMSVPDNLFALRIAFKVEKSFFDFILTKKY